MVASHKRASYTGLRHDVLALLGSRSRKALLDVGCSTGTTLRHCLDMQIVERAVGIECDALAASEAGQYANDIFVCNLDDFVATSLGKYEFDLIFLADVLEHTKEPEQVLREILKLSAKDVEVIISLPNVQHWTAIWNLLTGRWPQRERGLFDKTHLRFFTLKSIYHLAASTGLKVEKIRRNMRITDVPVSKINRLSKFMDFWPIRPFFTYQYVMSLKPIR